MRWKYLLRKRSIEAAWILSTVVIAWFFMHPPDGGYIKSFVKWFMENDQGKRVTDESFSH